MSIKLERLHQLPEITAAGESDNACERTEDIAAFSECHFVIDRYSLPVCSTPLRQICCSAFVESQVFFYMASKQG